MDRNRTHASCQLLLKQRIRVKQSTGRKEKMGQQWRWITPFDEMESSLWVRVQGVHPE